MDGLTIEINVESMYSILTSLLEEHIMLAKLTSKNQLTLPKAVLSFCQGTEYFDVSEENGSIVLVPVRLTKANAVRGKLADLGISEDDVADAVAWARDEGKQA
jgi:hypothetical protein